MPLSAPDARAPLVARRIECSGFQRDDGLVDVEGVLHDVRSFDLPSDWRRAVKAGDAVHELRVRLTVDPSLVVRAAEAAMDAVPYPTCLEVAPNLQRLVGVNVAGGFKREVRARIGGTEGCTHIIALLEALAPVVIQTVAATRRDESRDAALSTFDVRGTGRPPLIDTCRSYASWGEVVRQHWPDHYRPKREPGEA